MINTPAAITGAQSGSQIWRKNGDRKKRVSVEGCFKGLFQGPGSFFSGKSMQQTILCKHSIVYSNYM